MRLPGTWWHVSNLLNLAVLVIASHYKQSISPLKILVIPNAVDADHS